MDHYFTELVELKNASNPLLVLRDKIEIKDLLVHKRYCISTYLVKVTVNKHENQNLVYLSTCS